MPLSAGHKLGPYEILAPIGAGGMGEVYRAHDLRMGRDVAIKVTAERFSDRFSREMHAVAALNHSNIYHLYDVGPDYLVMELCEGGTLAARLKRGKLSIQETVRYGAQIANALSAAHAKGIVHRRDAASGQTVQEFDTDSVHKSSVRIFAVLTAVELAGLCTGWR